MTMTLMVTAMAMAMIVQVWYMRSVRVVMMLSIVCVVAKLVARR